MKEVKWLLSSGTNCQLDTLIEETHQMVQVERARRGLKPLVFGSRKTNVRKKPVNP